MSAVHKTDVAGIDYLSFVFDGVQNDASCKSAYIDAEDPNRAITIQQTRQLVRELIAGFKSAGLSAGDSVLVLLTNNIFYSSIFFGIIGAGGVYIGANPASQVFEISHIMQLTKPKAVITSPDLVPKVSDLFQEQGLLTNNVFVLDAKSFPLPPARDSCPIPAQDQHDNTSSHRWSPFSQLTSCGESDWTRFFDEDTAKKVPAAMFSTSGTSGLPKVAISSHYALVCQHLSMEHVPKYEVSRLISLPFFHCFAALFAHVWPIRNGQPLHILPRFQPDIFMDAIDRFQITDTIMAPPIVHTINQAAASIRGRLKTLLWVGVGGAPIAAEAMQTFEALLHPSASLSQVWGMTEIGVATWVRYPQRQCWGSIGRPLPGFEMKLIDSFGGTIQKDHEPGSLLVRYRGMMTGYKDHEPHPEGTWYETGDIMTRVDHKYFVVGRSKELIKVNAWQVAPAELEAVLLTHPAVKDAAVLGVLRDDGVTEVPRAYIVPKDGMDGKVPSITADEIYNFTRERLASYKALNGGVVFIDYIPRTASGKIQRFKLAGMDQYRQSVTELLVRNNAVVSEKKRDEVAELKAQADDVRTGNRRSARIAVRKTSVSGAATVRKTSPVPQPRRRSRTSLVEKMEALKASQTVIRVESMSPLSS